MIIQKYNAEALEKFINSNFYNHLQALPISRHRALSQIHNPRSEPEDILLLVAFENDDMIGYVGVLPDYYHIGDHRYKTGWLSCFWVNPDYRGKGISKLLGEEAVKNWNNKLFATEFTESSKRLWLKIKALESYITLNGLRCYYRFNLEEILPSKFRIFKTLKWGLKITDYSLNLLIEFRFRNKINRKNPGISFEKKSNLNTEDVSFINLFQSSSLFQRSEDELNWILHEPWILEPVDSYANRARYYFTSSENRFDSFAITIKDDQKSILAVLILSIRNRHLKTPYLFFAEKNSNIVVSLIEDIIISQKLTHFSTFNSFIVNYLKAKKYGSYIYAKEQKREYLVSPEILNQLKSSKQNLLYDGDGDCAFT